MSNQIWFCHKFKIRCSWSKVKECPKYEKYLETNTIINEDGSINDKCEFVEWCEDENRLQKLIKENR